MNEFEIRKRPLIVAVGLGIFWLLGCESTISHDLRIARLALSVESGVAPSLSSVSSALLESDVWCRVPGMEPQGAVSRGDRRTVIVRYQGSRRQAFAECENGLKKIGWKEWGDFPGSGGDAFVNSDEPQTGMYCGSSENQALSLLAIQDGDATYLSIGLFFDGFLCVDESMWDGEPEIHLPIIDVPDGLTVEDGSTHSNQVWWRTDRVIIHKTPLGVLGRDFAEQLVAQGWRKDAEASDLLTYYARFEKQSNEGNSWVAILSFNRLPFLERSKLALEVVRADQIR